MVIQGTIMYRIDSNVEQAHADTKLAVRHIGNKRKIEKSMRSKAVLMYLIAFITYCVFILLLRHT